MGCQLSIRVFERWFWDTSACTSNVWDVSEFYSDMNGDSCATMRIGEWQEGLWRIPHQYIHDLLHLRFGNHSSSLFSIEKCMSVHFTTLYSVAILTHLGLSPNLLTSFCKFPFPSQNCPSTNLRIIRKLGMLPMPTSERLTQKNVTRISDGIRC